MTPAVTLPLVDPDASRPPAGAANTNHAATTNAANTNHAATTNAATTNHTTTANHATRSNNGTADRRIVRRETPAPAVTFEQFKSGIRR